MAKRKRLTPAQPGYFNTSARAPETKSMPSPEFGAASAPIAQVASDAATRAALDEVTDVLRAARDQGRMIEALPLAMIDPAYLMRDRMVQDDEDMEALIASMRARGQQAPIEVTALADLVDGPGDGPTYGLISGARRLIALDRLYQETGEAQYATIKALVIAPGSAQDAYVAMVEENEIRANLSLYERARIALRAAREGIYPTPRHAVLGLFSATPRAKRSKIGRFVTLVEMLDGALAYPTAIAEKLGLDLVRALGDDAQLRQKLLDRLLNDPPKSSAEELRVLGEFVAARKTSKPPARKTDPVPDAVVAPDTAPPRSDETIFGLRVLFEQGETPWIELSGAGVDSALYRALKLWLVERTIGPQK